MEEKLEYKRKDYLCARCVNSCKWDCEMDYCDKFVAIEDAERIANANQIAALRKRCEEFMHDIVRDFGSIILDKTATVSETSYNDVDWNNARQESFTSKRPTIDFRLGFTVYKRD